MKFDSVKIGDRYISTKFDVAHYYEVIALHRNRIVVAKMSIGSDDVIEYSVFPPKDIDTYDLEKL